MNNFWHVLCILTFALIANAQSPQYRMKMANSKLANANKVLRNTLRELAVGQKVGSEQKVGGSGCSLAIKKSCTGAKFSVRRWDRETKGSDIGRYTNSGGNWCHKQCEYYGVNGCCQFDRDTEECWFSYEGTVVDDDLSKKVMISDLGQWPVEYRTDYYRESGMCTWNGNMKMVPHGRTEQCNFSGLDKEGQRQRPGTSSDVECTAYCLDYDDCGFAQLKDGVCKTFKTCKSDLYDSFDYKFTIWQKINDDAPWEWFDTRFYGQNCFDACETYKNEWIGDGMCDKGDCGACPFYTVDGVFDGGDCA